MRRGRQSAYDKFRKSGGFTLFEMVVVICCIVILYMVAEQRMNELPAAAERANFMGVLEQIKTGINFEMITRLAGDRFNELQGLEGSNPMNFLLEPPNNYLGELEEVTDTFVSRRRTWYYETSSGELVYVVGGPSLKDVFVNLSNIEVNLGQIRFRVTNIYDNEFETGDSEVNGSVIVETDSRGEWEGIRLEPVFPYRWAQRPETPVEI